LNTAGSKSNARGSISTEALQQRLDELKLSAQDAARILNQRTCPITKLALGSMGVPVRMLVGEHIVYLCCGGCKSRVAGAVDLAIAANKPPSSQSVPMSTEGAGEP